MIYGEPEGYDRLWGVITWIVFAFGGAFVMYWLAQFLEWLL